jgi:hypothetical protein
LRRRSISAGDGESDWKTEPTDGRPARETEAAGQHTGKTRAAAAPTDPGAATADTHSADGTATGPCRGIFDQKRISPMRLSIRPAKAHGRCMIDTDVTHRANAMITAHGSQAIGVAQRAVANVREIAVQDRAAAKLHDAGTAERAAEWDQIIAAIQQIQATD